MKQGLPFALAILLVGASVSAQENEAPAGPGAAAPAGVVEVLRGAVDPYAPVAERARFFQASGRDSELTVEEFAADRKQAAPFVRVFDHWPMLIGFDENRNGSIDWFEADAYRREVRREVLDAFCTSDDGTLAGDERATANRALASEAFLATCLGKGDPKRKDEGDRDGPPDGGASPAELTEVKTRMESAEKDRRELQRQLYDLQRTIERGNSVAYLRKMAEQARETAEKAEKVCAELAAARLLERAAYEDLKKARRESFEADPDTIALKREIEELDDRRAALSLKTALAELALRHRDSPVNRALVNDPELDRLRKAMYEIRDRKARQAASKAYAEAHKTAEAKLPEAVARRKQIDDCRRETAEIQRASRAAGSRLRDLQRVHERETRSEAVYAADARCRAAQEAVREAQKSLLIRSAKADYDEARRALSERVRQLLADHEQGAILAKKIRALEGEIRRLKSKSRQRRPERRHSPRT